MKMTIEEAIKKNPFDSDKGNKSAYCRYLRYNVEGWYNLDSKEVLKRWQKEEKNECETLIWKYDKQRKIHRSVWG